MWPRASWVGSKDQRNRALLKRYVNLDLNQKWRMQAGEDCYRWRTWPRREKIWHLWDKCRGSAVLNPGEEFRWHWGRRGQICRIWESPIVCTSSAQWQETIKELKYCNYVNDYPSGYRGRTEGTGLVRELDLQSRKKIMMGPARTG